MNAPPNFLQLTLSSSLNAKLTNKAQPAIPGALKSALKTRNVPGKANDSPFARDDEKTKVHTMRPSTVRKGRNTPPRSPRKNLKSGRLYLTHRSAEKDRKPKAITKEKSFVKRLVAIKKPEPVDHPLFFDYKEAASNWTTEAAKSLNENLSTAIDELTTTLTDAIDKSNILRITHSDAVAACIKPLTDQILRIRLNVHTPNEQVFDARLGDQMETFRKQTDVEYHKLRGLWKNWERVRREIAGMVVGEPEGDAGTEGTLGDSVGRGVDSYAEAAQELEEEYVRERRKLLTQYEKDCTELLRRLEESDKAMEKNRRQQKELMLNMMQQQLKAIEESDDEA